MDMLEKSQDQQRQRLEQVLAARGSSQLEKSQQVCYVPSGRHSLISRFSLLPPT
jgi:hypothetical protein